MWPYLLMFVVLALLDYFLFGWSAVGMQLRRFAFGAQAVLRPDAISPRKP